MNDEQLAVFLEGLALFAPTGTDVCACGLDVECGLYLGARRIAVTMRLWTGLWTAELRRRGNYVGRRLAQRKALLDAGFESVAEARIAHRMDVLAVPPFRARSSAP